MLSFLAFIRHNHCLLQLFALSRQTIFLALFLVNYLHLYTTEYDQLNDTCLIPHLFSHPHYLTLPDAANPLNSGSNVTPKFKRHRHIHSKCAPRLVQFCFSCFFCFVKVSIPGKLAGSWLVWGSSTPSATGEMASSTGGTARDATSSAATPTPMTPVTPSTASSTYTPPIVTSQAPVSSSQSPSQPQQEQLRALTKRDLEGMLNSLHTTVADINHQIVASEARVLDAVELRLATFETKTLEKLENMMDRFESLSSGLSSTPYPTDDIKAGLVDSIESQLSAHSELLSTTASNILSNTKTLIKESHEGVIAGVSRVLEVQQKERTVSMQKLNDFRSRLEEVEDIVDDNAKKIADILEHDVQHKGNPDNGAGSAAPELGSESGVELDLELSRNPTDGEGDDTGSFFNSGEQHDPLQTPRANRMFALSFVLIFTIQLRC